jgi:hypothetical protein
MLPTDVTSLNYPRATYNRLDVCLYLHSGHYYRQGRRLGIPPRHHNPSLNAILRVNNIDILSVAFADKRCCTPYVQRQVDFIEGHGIALKEAFSPVLSAFARSPQHSGVVLNFCT